MAHAHTYEGVAAGDGNHRQLMITLALTGSVFVAEVVGAIITGSLALLVDAGHMLTDMSVLAASTITAVLMRRKPNGSRTWGWARLEVITAAEGATVLLFVGVYALIESGMRLFGGHGDGVRDFRLLLLFGVLGLAANVGSILVLAAHSKDNMNMKAAFLEVVNDALGSVAVVVSAVVMMVSGWGGFDAVAGGLIAVLMIPRAVRLLVSAGRVLLEETPEGLDLDDVRRHLEEVPQVVAVHDLHASTVATGMPVLMAHVVVSPGLTMEQASDVLAEMQNCLREHFPVSIEHTTFQLEPEGYTSPSAATMHA